MVVAGDKVEGQPVERSDLAFAWVIAVAHLSGSSL